MCKVFSKPLNYYSVFFNKQTSCLHQGRKQAWKRRRAHVTGRTRTADFWIRWFILQCGNTLPFPSLSHTHFTVFCLKLVQNSEGRSSLTRNCGVSPFNFLTCLPCFLIGRPSKLLTISTHLKRQDTANLKILIIITQPWQNIVSKNRAYTYSILFPILILISLHMPVKSQSCSQRIRRYGPLGRAQHSLGTKLKCLIFCFRLLYSRQHWGRFRIKLMLLIWVHR